MTNAEPDARVPGATIFSATNVPSWLEHLDAVAPAVRNVDQPVTRADEPVHRRELLAAEGPPGPDHRSRMRRPAASP